jgi:hypothetical protein
MPETQVYDLLTKAETNFGRGTAEDSGEFMHLRPGAPSALAEPEFEHQQRPKPVVIVAAAGVMFGQQSADKGL